MASEAVLSVSCAKNVINNDLTAHGKKCDMKEIFAGESYFV